MEFSTWPVEELEALARVYVKHKQFHRAQGLRTELENRIKEANGESRNLSILFDQLDTSNVVSLTDRLLGRAKLFA